MADFANDDQQNMGNPLMTITQSSQFPLQQYASASSPVPMVPTDNVLNTPERQAQLGQAYDMFLNKILTGPSKFDKGAAIGEKVFTNLVAPAVAAFGPPGTSAGAAQFMKGMAQDVRQKSLEHQAQSQHYMSAMKDIASILNTTSLKPLSEVLKNDRATRGMDIRENDVNSKISHRKVVEGQRTQTEQRLNKALDLRRELGTYGYNLKNQALEEAKRWHDVQGDLRKQIALHSGSLAKARIDATRDSSMASLLERYHEASARRQQAVDIHNSDVAKAVDMFNSKNPKAKIAADRYLVNFDESVPAPTQPDREPTDDEYAQSEQLLRNYAPRSAASALPAFGLVPTGNQAQPAQQRPNLPVFQMSPDHLRQTFQQRIKATGITADQGKVQFINEAVQRGIPYQDAARMTDGF